MRLPVPVTPLLGRERELEETMLLLGRTRLLTITGAGGSGKTRLALELAHRVQEQYDEVIWLDFGSLAEPGLVAQQVASALGLREAPRQDAVAMIVDHLRDRSMLLLFDNCEHLVDACAAVAEAILRGSAEARIVATSREALGIGGEQTWLVPPLALDDATALFVERARAVSPSFDRTPQNAAFVARICERLDGIPLAIELAAARVKVLSVEQIADRLADAFRLLSSGSRTIPRHRTIRETIDWSYRLLSEEGQIVLRRLAVFAGSFSLAAAEEICGGGDADVLEQLSALVDKSLVLRSRQDGEARYRLLETVRQFAAEKLEESGERELVRGKHAAYYVAAVEAIEPRLFAGASDFAAIACVDEDSGNLRAVFDWAEEDASRCAIEMRLLYAIHWYWFARAHFNEASRRTAAARARQCDVPPGVRARALLADATLATWQGDWARAGASANAALPELLEGNDGRATALVLTTRAAAIAYADRDAAAAKVAFDEAKAAARRNGVDVSVALTLYWSGLAAELRGDWAAARADFEEGVRIGEQTGNRQAIAHPSTVLGHVALREGKYAEAVACFHRALEIHAEVDDRWGLTHAIEGIGLALLDSGDAEVGTRLLAAASAAWLRLGARPARLDDFEQEKSRRIREALSDDRLRVALASGAALSYDDMVAIARRESERLLERSGGATAKAATAQHASGDRSPLLRVRALGPFEVYRAGELVDAASQSARARELLLFLLTHPQGCTKEQIGAALWPDADPAKLRNNFHVTMHRLRKSLGAAELVTVEGELYSIDRRAGVDFDAETFERDVTRALKKKEDVLPLLAHAVSLYRGDLFESGSGSGEWVDELRDRLRDLYARALTTLGRAQLAAGDARGAADAYQRLVALDDLDEDATRNLMTAFAKAGDPTAAARAYKRLTEALRRELDTEPEPVTAKLAAKIAAGEVA